MEIIQPKDTEYEYFINRTIMIPERNGLNNFYQVIT